MMRLQGYREGAHTHTHTRTETPVPNGTQVTEEKKNGSRRLVLLAASLSLVVRPGARRRKGRAPDTKPRELCCRCALIRDEKRKEGEMSGTPFNGPANRALVLRERRRWRLCGGGGGSDKV